MCNLRDLLQKIGLSEKESAIYLASLKLGSNPASIIAKKSEINRCTTYSVLDALLQKGLVTEYEKDRIKYFTAISPEQLLDYIDEKKRDLAYCKNEIQSNMDKLKAIQHKEQLRPSIQPFSGKAGLSQIYNSVINEDQLFIWCSPAKHTNEFFIKFAPEYLKKKKMLKIIKYSNNNVSRYEIKTLQELNGLPLIQPLEFISREKVILTSAYDPYGVEIANPEIVKYFKNKFNLYWQNKKAPSLYA